MRFHSANLAQLSSPLGQHRIGNELGKSFVVDRQDFWNEKRRGFADFRQQILHPPDPRKKFVVSAVLGQLQGCVVIYALEFQIERLFKLKHLCQRLCRIPYSPFPVLKLWIRPLKPGKIFLPFADIGKNMRQVPLVRVGNVSASRSFHFVHEEIVTRNVFASTSEKAALGTRDFRPIALGAKHASAVISPGMASQIGVATLSTSVFHSRHGTAFDLAVIRRVSRYNGGLRDKLRSGGQGDKRTRGRASS